MRSRRALCVSLPAQPWSARRPTLTACARTDLHRTGTGPPAPPPKGGTSSLRQPGAPRPAPPPPRKDWPRKRRARDSAQPRRNLDRCSARPSSALQAQIRGKTTRQTRTDADGIAPQSGASQTRGESRSRARDHMLSGPDPQDAGIASSEPRPDARPSIDCRRAAQGGTRQARFSPKKMKRSPQNSGLRQICQPCALLEQKTTVFCLDLKRSRRSESQRHRSLSLAGRGTFAPPPHSHVTGHDSLGKRPHLSERRSHPLGEALPR